MTTKKKVLSNALFQGFGKVLTVIASFFVVKIVSGFGAEFYGSYLTAYEFLAFFGILADGGLFAIAVREMSRSKIAAVRSGRTNQGEAVVQDVKPTEFILGNVFSMRLILIVTVTILAGISAQFVPAYSPVVKLGIWITGLSMALSIVAGTLSSVLQARMKIQYFSGALVLGKILLAVMIFFIARNVGLFDGNLLFAMFWAGVLSNIVFCVLVYIFTRREVAIGLKFDFDWWRETLRKSLPYGLSLVLQTLYLRLDIVLISMILGSAAVGVYGISTRILESFLILGVFFGQAILPKISAEDHDSKKVGETLVWGGEKLLILSLPIIIGSVAFAPNIIKLLSSSEFISSSGFFGADSVLIVLVPTVFFAFFNQLFSFALLAVNQQKYLLKVNATALGLNAILNLIFLQKFGIVAAAVSTVFCEVVVLALLAHKITTSFPLRFSWLNIGLIFLANAILLAEIYLTPLQENFILAAVVGSLTYFSFCFLCFGRRK